MLDLIFAHIDDHRDDLVALTQDLIRIPTVNPPGDAYRPCAELLGRRLARSGFEISYLRATDIIGDSDRYPRVNMLARRPGRGPGTIVHFNGHIDVVEAGRGWSVDPFAGTIVDGKIVGRGSADMKGGIACAVIALESLIRTEIPMHGALELSATVDEESGGYGGVAHLAKQGVFSKPRVDHVIIPEPLDVDRICIGHRGVWWAEIETFGRIAHGSMPFLGDCAIRHMSAFVSALECELMPSLEARTTIMPVVPDAARHSTLNVATIEGGLTGAFEGLPSANVADHCRLVIDRRFLPEERLADVKAEIIELLERLAAERPGFTYAVSDMMEVLPTLVPKDTKVVQAVADAIRRVLDVSPALVASPGTFDQKHIHRIGQLDECIAYGPGRLELAHQPDEHVVIDDLVAAAKVMAASTLHLLGVNVH